MSQALTSARRGPESTTFNDGADQYEVRIRAVSGFRTMSTACRRLIVPSVKGRLRPADRLVNITQAPARVRSNVEPRTPFTLLANTRPGGSDVTIQTAIDEAVGELIFRRLQPPDTSANQRKWERPECISCWRIALSFIFMYIVLAAQSNRYSSGDDLADAAAIEPFGILSLLIAGQTVNIFSGLGLLLLFGV